MPRLKHFKKKYGPWVLVTGASSGIGLAFAKQLAALGLNIILVARRKKRLSALSTELKTKHGVETKVVCADLSRDDFMNVIQSATEALEVGLLINNAGFGTTGHFVENELSREIKMLHVNCRAPLILAHYFGKLMKDRKKGGIIFSSSIVAFTAVPLWSNYAATKSYDLLLAEGLASELKDVGVDVLALCPGTTEAEFQETAGTKKIMPMSADIVVAAALKGLGRKRVVIPGWFNTLNVLLIKLQPRSWSAKIFGAVIRSIQKKVDNR